MPFIATAVLVASICPPNEDCKIEKVAGFYHDSGQDFCEGTAGAIIGRVNALVPLSTIRKVLRRAT